MLLFLLKSLISQCFVEKLGFFITSLEFLGFVRWYTSHNIIKEIELTEDNI